MSQAQVNIPVVGTGDTGPVGVAVDTTPQGAAQVIKLAISDISSSQLLTVDPAKGIPVEVKSLPPIQLFNSDGVPVTIVVEPGEGKFVVEGRADGNPIPVTMIPDVRVMGWSPKFFAAVVASVLTLKTGPTEIGGWFILNPNASTAYVQIFNTLGSVTLGTTVPDMALGIPAGSAANLHIEGGIGFRNGVRFACTTTATGLTAPGTGLDVNFWFV